MAIATKPLDLEESYGGGGGAADGGGDWGESGSGGDAGPEAGLTGIWIAIASIVMFFAAFTSAMVVRAGLGNDWTSMALPRILYLNTAVLMASSLTLEHSRRALRAGRARRFSGWLFLTTGLGMAFLAGQAAAWRELRARGVDMAGSPASSFFYLLTAAHAVHVLGGLAALLYLVARRRTIALDVGRWNRVQATAIYWHFMDGLWVYLLFVLTRWL